MFEVDNVKNKENLLDFYIFLTWQRQKRSNSARLPQLSKLTASKTKQFSETSFKNGKLSAEPMASYQCVLRFVHSTWGGVDWPAWPAGVWPAGPVILHIIYILCYHNFSQTCSKKLQTSKNYTYMWWIVTKLYDIWWTYCIITEMWFLVQVTNLKKVNILDHDCILHIMLLAI